MNNAMPIESGTAITRAITAARTVPKSIGPMKPRSVVLSGNHWIPSVSSWGVAVIAGQARTTRKRATASAAGTMILVTLAAVALFLVVRAWPAVIALVIAVPLSIGIALFISHYAPRRAVPALGYLVDLLAAIPSVVYGLWGVVWLAPRLQPVWQWLAEHLGFIPLFSGPAGDPPRVIMTVGVVLAVMIGRTITAVAREVFLQTPRLHEEAALALGATRWEMIRMAVLPFGRSGLVSAAMLGLGRALGETMAVLMILSPGFTYSFALLRAGRHQTIAADIANQFPEANPLGVSALIAAGLALFVITLVVNLAARWVVARRSEYSGAN